MVEGHKKKKEKVNGVTERQNYLMYKLMDIQDDYDFLLGVLTHVRQPDDTEEMIY